MPMTREDALKFIHATNGKIFAIKFTKRTTGELRTMNCRLKVTKHLKGGTAPYDFKEKNLILVFDMTRVGYRTVPVEGITEVEVNGQWHQVV